MSYYRYLERGSENMSKQSNQRYRKELEESTASSSQPKKSNKATTTNNTKTQSSSYDYKEDFDDISLDYDDDSDY